MTEQSWRQIVLRGGVRAWPLSLASLGYRAGFAIVKALKRPSVRVKVPVVSVGSISVGGSGKTPIVGLLAQLLADRGYKVGIVARGYKRAGHAPLMATGAEIQAMPVAQTGDEVMLLAQFLPQVVFSVDSSKSRAARRLAESGAADLIVVDDGFQHWRLYRNVDIVLMDASMRPEMAHSLPRGILREGFGALSRADVIIITRANIGRHVEWVRGIISQTPGKAPVFEARYIAYDIHAGVEQRLPISYLKSKSVFLFAGVGQFEALMNQVSRMAGRLAGWMELDDHQAYDQALVARIAKTAESAKADLLLTTGKDWVKLGNFDFGRETYYLGLTVKIDQERELVDVIERKIKFSG